MTAPAVPTATYTPADPTQQPVVISAAPIADLRAKTTYTETDVNVATEPPLGTALGDLRRGVVDLQAQVNEFLTAKMNEK